MHDTNQFVEDCLKIRSNIQIVHPGQTLTIRDQQFVGLSLAMRNALARDLLLNASYQDIRRSILAIRCLDTQAYFSDWKKLTTAFMQYVSSPSVDADLQWQGFKHLANDAVHYKWIATSLRPFFCLDLPVLLRIRKIRQWLVFDSRLNLKSVNLEDAMAEEYLLDERLLASFSYAADDESAVIRDWFDGYAPALLPFRPRHGPGATHETKRGSSAIAKLKEFRVDDELTQFITDCLWEDTTEFLLNPAFQDTDTWRTCDLVCVPKSPLTNRTISKEPATLQWFQQGVRDQIDSWLSSHSHIPIHLHDQDESRALCLEGSRRGGFDTIDLSKASDYVTLALVEQLFSGTDLLFPLLATRSHYVNVSTSQGKESVRMAKFAPMGSACCFPVECLVFASVCEAVVRQISGRRSRKYDYVVYGDDIVIRHEFFQPVVEELTRLNFLVNESKSFSGQGPFVFREACGIECLNGIDISPLRISRKLTPFFGDVCSPVECVSWCDFINHAYDYGFTELRALLLWCLKSVTPSFHQIQRVPYEEWCRGEISGSAPYLVTAEYYATNYGCRTRWNGPTHDRPTRPGLFLSETEVVTVGSKPNADVEDAIRTLDGEYCLFYWQSLSRYAPSELYNEYSSLQPLDAGKCICGEPGRPGWRRKWVPSISTGTLFSTDT